MAIQPRDEWAVWFVGSRRRDWLYDDLASSKLLLLSEWTTEASESSPEETVRVTQVAVRTCPY
jgi:hypothetical protein